MKKLLLFVGAVIGVLVIAAIAVLVMLDDPNRFKPELENLVADATGFDVSIDGDLGWSLWPPVVLSGEDVQFADAQTQYELGSLAVDVDLLELLTSGGNLVIDDLVLQDLVVTDRELGNVTRVHRLALAGFTPGQPGPAELAATLEAEDGTATDVTVAAALTLDIDADTLRLEDADIDYGGTPMTCDVAAAGLSRTPTIAHESTREDLLPLNTFRSLDWVADCVVPRVELDGTAITDVTVHSENTGARSQTDVNVANLFGGALDLDIGIDARKRTPLWHIETDADGLRSQDVMDIVSPQLAWVAPLLGGGEFELRGNTVEELANSVSGGARIDAGKGLIDVTMIKQSVLELAQLAGKADEIMSWPEQLNYENLVADWVVDGKTHAVTLALDNIALAVNGDLDPLTGGLEMRGSVSVQRHETLDSFKVNPLLYDVPIPVRCTGTVNEPVCALDSEAAQRTVAAIAAGQAREKVDREIEDVLEDKVPEEYRDTARSALEEIGDLFGKKKKRD